MWEANIASNLTDKLQQTVFVSQLINNLISNQKIILFFSKRKIRLQKRF
jgi:hypothetical protein